MNLPELSDPKVKQQYCSLFKKTIPGKGYSIVTEFIEFVGDNKIQSKLQVSFRFKVLNVSYTLKRPKQNINLT